MTVRMTMTMKKTKTRCRLCASEEGFGSFYNIFDENSHLELEVKIAKLLPVVVTPWDTMPHVVCPECIEKLNSFNEFFEASLKAEEVLKSLEPSDWGKELENVMESPKKQEERSEVVGGKHDERPKWTLECFIVNRITPKESVYTCRHCYRTYTKQSSALTHYCVVLDDCREEEEGGEEKSLPPLKIRLFSVKCGLFVCYLCQMQFEEKTSLVEHIKSHFLEGKSGIRKKKKRRGHCQEENNGEGGWKEVYTKRKKKRKKSTDSTKKKKCQKPESIEECENRGDGQTSVMESTTEKAAVTCDTEVTDEVQVIAGPTPESQEGSKSDEEGGSTSDEVTVLEVIDNRSSFFSAFSACVFCDKVFTTKEALVGHQNRHILGFPEDQAENVQKTTGNNSSEGTTLCGVCGMSFTNSATLLNHVQFHVVRGQG